MYLFSTAAGRMLLQSYDLYLSDASQDKDIKRYYSEFPVIKTNMD